ncbi:hypothetical protein CG723_39000 [Streptomyces sp. CB01635]|nr:hypothetical protein CG723_39000 [Streptomyces sp. CB01635]
MFQQVLPHLLARIDDQGLRDQLLAAAGSTYVTEALRNGALGRRRWVIERTMSWLTGYRRLSPRYERQPANYLA